MAPVYSLLTHEILLRLRAQEFGQGFVYNGYSKNLVVRFNAHNSRKVTPTKQYAPLALIHYGAYRIMKDAKRREKYLKSSKGKTTLVTLLREFFLAIFELASDYPLSLSWLPIH